MWRLFFIPPEAGCRIRQPPFRGATLIRLLDVYGDAGKENIGLPSPLKMFSNYFLHSYYTNMATCYKFRYTLRTDVEDSATLAWLTSACPGHLVIRHDADAEVAHAHWHAILRSEKKCEALRQGFRRACPDAPKAGYSLGVVKAGEDHVYERYMCHGASLGDRVVIVSAGGIKYTQSWAQDQNAAFYAAQTEFKARVKAKAKGSTVQELLEECKAVDVRTRRGVAVVLIKMFTRQQRAMIESYMKAVVTSVCVALEIEASADTLADRLTFISSY